MHFSLALPPEIKTYVSCTTITQQSICHQFSGGAGQLIVCCQSEQLHLFVQLPLQDLSPAPFCPKHEHRGGSLLKRKGGLRSTFSRICLSCAINQDYVPQQ